MIQNVLSDYVCTTHFAYVTYLPLCRGLWVRIADKACWLAYYKNRLDVVGHPGTSDILHFTYHIVGRTKSFSGILNTRVVRVLERRGREEEEIRSVILYLREATPEPNYISCEKSRSCICTWK